jgi:MFS family permease
MDSPQERPTIVRHKVNALLLLLAAVTYMDRVCIAQMAAPIRADLGLDDRGMGLVFSAFSIAYALFEVPSGWLIDRFGPRWMLARIVLWWSLLTAATGLATGLVSLLVIRFLFGLGEAGSFPGVARVFDRWMPNMAHGRGFGIVLLAGTWAGFLTQPLVSALMHHFSWRWVFALCALPGIAWAAVWFLWFRDDPADHRGVNEAEKRLLAHDQDIAAHPDIPWRKLIGSPNVWWLWLMYFGIIYGWYFYLQWLRQFVDAAQIGTGEQRAWLSGLPMLGLGAGVFCGGILTDFLVPRMGLRRGRRLPGLCGLPAAAAFLLLAWQNGANPAAVWCMTAAAFCSALGVAPGWAVCLDIGREYAGTVSGSMNMFGNLGGALIPIVTGYSRAGTGSWTPALLSMAFCYLLAALAWAFIDPTKRILTSGSSPNSLGSADDS